MAVCFTVGDGMAGGEQLPRPNIGRKTYFVSRHDGAYDWAKRHGISADYVQHVDLDSIGPGDNVIGNLPADFVAEIIQRGGRYFHIALRISTENRGKELTADQMDAAGAHLVELTLCRKGVITASKL